jgi:hypothetical protein
MPRKANSTQKEKKKPTTAKEVVAKAAPPVKALSVEPLKKTIAYFYLVSYCPPDKIQEFLRSTAPMRRNIARQAGMNETTYFAQVIPEVCRRIVAFHQATREPDQAVVNALTEAVYAAGRNLGALGAFQTQMARVAAMPGRAKPENRLHRNKGCALCQAPCQYGYFTLVSDPHFDQLQELLTAEAKKPAAKQSPLFPAYAFTIQHLAQLTGEQQGFMGITHLTNLSYCLLMLGMAKSRLGIPEDQLRLIQEANQEFIRRAKASK